MMARKPVIFNPGQRMRIWSPSSVHKDTTPALMAAEAPLLQEVVVA
jgi:hypothetical protein